MEVRAVLAFAFHVFALPKRSLERTLQKRRHAKVVVSL